MKSADVLRKITQKKMANGLTTTEGLKNGTVVVWRIRIQKVVDVGDVVVVEVRTSLQKLDADVDLVSITSFLMIFLFDVFS